MEKTLANEPVDKQKDQGDQGVEPDVEHKVSETASPESKKHKKRKRKANEDEGKAEQLESRYLNKLSAKLFKDDRPKVQHPEDNIVSAPDADEGIEHEREGDVEDDLDPSLLQHETLATERTATDNTIFISNLPIKASTSKPHLKALKHLFSAHGQIQSIRFRSIAFTDLVPRKVAFITKKMHPERDTCNAYIVYASKESGNAAVRALNGYVWEGKHLRVDSVANPTVPSLLGVRG